MLVNSRKTLAQMHQQRHNKALHPTAYAPVVPPYAAAAGELGR